MRGLALVLAAGTIAYVGCSGDTSALMSVWNNDAGVVRTGGVVASGGAVGGATGAGYGGQSFAKGGSGGYGYGGQPFVMGGSGGAATGGNWGVGGAVGASGGASGVVYVNGGVRDLATGLCIGASGGSCAVSKSYLTCLDTSCVGERNRCYDIPTGGPCQDYVNCMLQSPCDTQKDTYESKCLQAYGAGELSCWNCLVSLNSCAASSCPPINECPSSAGGAAGVGGAAGSTGGFPSTPVDAGPIIKLDAGPTYPRDARGFELYVVGPPVDGGSFWFPEVGRPDGLPIPTDLNFLRPEVLPPNLP
jgi:hypothetical protein